MAKDAMQREEFRIGCICPLDTEMTAIIAMFDEKFEKPQDLAINHNAYEFGRIGSYNVVVAYLGDTGTNSAATVASQLCASFPSVTIGLMVGCGGGVPSVKNDIRLGDVVVSQPEGNLGGVVQYDLGKTKKDGEFERSSHLNRPPSVLLKAVKRLKTQHNLHDRKLDQYLIEARHKYPKLRSKWSYQGKEHDLLFQPQFDHKRRDEVTCTKCDQTQLIYREDRDQNTPVIHYGTIASGNQVVRHGLTRDKVAEKYGALCFEMEAAGLMNHFSCLVIRGICDYADSHKNKRWQPYAAAAAAAYAKDLLCTMSAQVLTQTPHVVSDPAPGESQLSAGLDIPATPQYNQHSTIKAKFYRVHDDDCATKYTKAKGFFAQDQDTNIIMVRSRNRDEKRKAYNILDSHLQWGNRKPSPLISAFSNKSTALKYAELRVKRGQSGVFVAAVGLGKTSRTNKPVYWRSVRDLSDELGLWIHEKAWSHSKDELVFLHHIPACMIVDVWRLN